jgi:hypothetical protein
VAFQHSAAADRPKGANLICENQYGRISDNEWVNAYFVGLLHYLEHAPFANILSIGNSLVLTGRGCTANSAMQVDRRVRDASPLPLIKSILEFYVSDMTPFHHIKRVNFNIK